MQMSYSLIHRLLSPWLGDGDWQSASDYGEPGYSFRHDATTGIVVLGNYWCNCGKNPMTGKQGQYAGGSNPYYVTKPSDLHDLASHHPRVWRQMELQGVEFEWYDEWTIDSDHDKAYRTQSDSYHWMPAYQLTDTGDMLTADDDIAEWVEWAKNNPQRCIPTRIVKRDQLEAAGFMLIHDRLENGLHHGMDDDPQAYYDMESGKVGQDGSKWDYVFMLDDVSQFYITFSMMARVQEDES